ncbi:flippase [Vibrio campbellii]|nr:flippase [Vibrio campbellii]
MKGFLKYFKNTSWLLTEKIIRMGTNLIVLSVVSRYLGVENFGIYNYIMGLTAIFITLSTLGIDSVVVKYLVEGKHSSNSIMGSAFVIKLIGSIFSTFVLFMFVSIMDVDEYVIKFSLLVMSVSFMQSVTIIDYYYQSIVKSKFISIISMLSLFLGCILKLVVVHNDLGINYLFYVYLIEVFIIVLLQLVCYINHGNEIKKWNVDKIVVTSLLKESLPLVFAGLLNSIYMKVDSIMIERMHGFRDVGLYTSAVRLSEVWFSIGVIICNSLFPAIVRCKDNHELYMNRLLYLFKMLVLFSVALSFFTMLTSNYIIYYIYGEDYAQSSGILTVHIFSTLFVWLGVASGRWLISEGKPIISLQRNVLALIFNVVLNIIFIPSHGIIAAAYTSLISYFIGFYLFDLIRKDTREIFKLKTKAILFPYSVLRISNLKRLV